RRIQCVQEHRLDDDGCHRTAIGSTLYRAFRKQGAAPCPPVGDEPPKGVATRGPSAERSHGNVGAVVGEWFPPSAERGLGPNGQQNTTEVGEKFAEESYATATRSCEQSAFSPAREMQRRCFPASRRIARKATSPPDRDV